MEIELDSQIHFPSILNFIRYSPIDFKNRLNPKTNDKVPYSYQKLMEKYWDSNPEKRPSFNEIVNFISINPGFITKTVDKEEFLDYFNYFYEIEREETYSSFYSSNKKKEKNFGQTKIRLIL